MTLPVIFTHIEQEGPLRARAPGQLANHPELVCYLPGWLLGIFALQRKPQGLPLFMSHGPIEPWTFPLLPLLFSWCNHVVSP